jgi:ribokinase
MSGHESGSGVRADVAFVGSPFLDITFEGLAEVPTPGREVYARRLHLSPGGLGAQAVAASRLGLATVIVSPVAAGAAGRILREVFDAEHVRWIGPEAEGVPVTAVMPFPDGPAMATFHPDEALAPEDVSAVGARAHVISLGRLPLRPPEARTYAITGQAEAVRFAASVPDGLRDAEAFIANHDEVRILTGEGDPERGVRRLADLVGTAVVTLGAEGAIGVAGREIARAAGPPVEAVDVTGGGDLFVGAYVWADLCGLPLPERLSWAVLYASLSVRTITPLAGALRLPQLLEEGRRAGLAVDRLLPG